MDELEKEFLAMMNKFRILKKRHKEYTELPHAEFFMLYTIDNCMRQKQQKGLSMIGVTASEILEDMECSMSAVSKLTRILEEKGYLCRINSKEDRRITYLILSEKGKEMLHKANEKRKISFNHIVTEMGEENMKELIELLEKVYDIMSREMEEI